MSKCTEVERLLLGLRNPKLNCMLMSFLSTTHRLGHSFFLASKMSTFTYLYLRRETYNSHIQSFFESHNTYFGEFGPP